MKKYIEFKITSIPFLPDLLSGLFWELDIIGIMEQENNILVYANENSRIKKSDFVFLLSKLKKENLIESFEIGLSNLSEKNWNEEWERSLDVIKVSKKIVIKPSFKSYLPQEDEIVIEIDPKMSFGTGEHETTRLVLRLLEKYLVKNNRVLDVGSGTGILSICSVLLGASGAIALDNNEWCYLNGRENVRKNKVEEKVEVRQGEIKDVEENNFDLILANINKNALKEIKNDLIARLNKKGRIILSGILISDSAEIIGLYESKHIRVIDSLIEGEWIAVVLEKL